MMKRYLTALALAAGLAAPPAGAAEILPRFEPGACPVETPGQVMECGDLVVAQDHGDPAAGTLRLATLIYRSSNPAKAVDPLIYLHGGPGTAALLFETRSPGLFDNRIKPFLADRDVILYDQRGVGFSKPSLTCDEFAQTLFAHVQQVGSPDQLVDLVLPAVTACRQRLETAGVRLQSFNSKESALDLADLRRALNLSAVNLLGQSYGTRIALSALRYAPDGIRSVILSSPAPASDTASKAPLRIATFLDRFYAACAADASCAKFGDLRAKVAGLVERLNAQPVELDTSFPVPGFSYSGMPIRWRLTGDQIPGMLFGEMYSEKSLAALPGLIQALGDGDVKAMTRLVTANGVIPMGAVNLGTFLGTTCNDSMFFETKAGLAAALATQPQLRGLMWGRAHSFGPRIIDVCQAFVGRTQPFDADYQKPVTSKVPALVVAGEWDAATPPQNARDAAQGLRHSQIVTVPGTAHGPVFANDCTRDIARRFLAAPTATVDQACLAQVPGLVFKGP